MRTLLLAGLALGILTTVASAGPLVPALPPRPAASTATLVGIGMRTINGNWSGVRGRAGSLHSGGVNNGAGRAPAGGAHRGR